jgi:hypothetical protein
MVVGQLHLKNLTTYSNKTNEKNNEPLTSALRYGG